MVQMVREGAETGSLPNSTDFMKEFEVSRRTVARDLDFLRDAAGNDGAQGAGAVGLILDAGREGARPEEPAGSDRGETAGWTPRTAIR